MEARTAIVTGGAKRIGAELVRALAADGWHVLIHYRRSRAEAEALAAELGNAATVQADLADPAAAETILAAADGLPPLRLLVNNASRFVHDDIARFHRRELGRPSRRQSARAGLALARLRRARRARA